VVALMAVAEAGIDTARVLYRVHAERDHDRLTEVCGGSLGMVPGEHGGLRAGWMREHELLWLEGRPAKALGLGSALLPPQALHDGMTKALGELSEAVGLGRVVEVGVSRLDATATMQLERPSEGWALLRGMAALDMPRRKAALYVNRGRPETVYRLTESGKVKERIYDKGAQLGGADTGTRIRFEAQTRWPAGTRDTMGLWSAERTTDEFERRFRPMARAAEGLRVASEGVIRELVKEMVDGDAITPRMAELLLGHIASESVGLPRPERTVRRRRAELKRLGLSHALDGLEGDDVVDVPLADVLDELLGATWDG
jgi:hypothetical protein